MNTPIIGIESVFFSIMTSIVLVVYAILFYPVVKRSFIMKSQNRYNSLLVIILIIVIAVFISLPFSATTYYLFMPLNYYFLVVVGSFLIILLIYIIGGKETIHEDDFNRELSKDLDENLSKSIQDTHNFSPRQELKRKVIHLTAILYLLSWVLVPLIFYGVSFSYNVIANTTTTENFSNAQLLFEDSVIELILFNGLIVHFFMLLCIMIGNADIELMRLRFKKYNFPLKKTLQLTRRPTEINDISASLLLLLGLAVSSLILTYGSEDRIAGVYAVMAVICISVFSDMFAALIGRKWGKHKWKIIPGKSYEGSLAGFLIGFFTAIFFVGWFLALIGALIFIFTDIALDKVNISDNALNPILIAIIFKLLISYVNPIITLLPIIRIW